MQVLRVLAPEGNLSSASNVGFAKLVRVHNNKNSVQIITHTESGGKVIRNVTPAANEVGY